MELFESNGESFPPDVKYHRDCHQRFIMKKILDRIERKSSILKEKERQNQQSLQSLLNVSDTYLTTANPLPPRTLPGTSLSSTLLPDSCIICDKKLKYVKRKPESLRKCEMKKTQSTLKAYAAEKKDIRMLSMISPRDLIAAEAKYHPSCYQEYMRPKRKSKQMDDVKVAYKRVELEAYHVVIKTCHEMICKENIIKMQDLSNIMVNYL